MPRPQLAIGDYGHVSYTVTAGGLHVAMARFRDADGETRKVTARGRSKSAAGAALKVKFKERERNGSEADLCNESLVSVLAERYYLAKCEEDLAANTRYNLRRALDNHVIPKLGKLRIREVTPPRVERMVAGVTKLNGPGTAQTVRSTLSGMFSSAVRWGATAVNPVTHTQRPKLVQKEIRALTIPELVLMRAHAVRALTPFTYQERIDRAGGDKSKMGGKARSQMPLDIMDFLLATGCRAGEAPGLAWEDVHLDDPVPWVEIRQQVVREIGVGLLLTPTKERDVRRLRLPAFAVEMLRRREAVAKGPMVFPNERGGLLAPRNLATAWKNIFAPDAETRKKLSEKELDERYPWRWVTQKTLRKTVATLVSEEHGSALASKQLGHASDKMTRDYYIAKSMVPVDAGKTLEMFGQGSVRDEASA